MFQIILSSPYVCPDNIYFRERDFHSVKRMIPYDLSICNFSYFPLMARYCHIVPFPGHCLFFTCYRNVFGFLAS